MTGVARVAVVVPVRDEEQLLPGCLHALRTAVRRLQRERALPVEVVVVLDSCTDASPSLVAAEPWVRSLAVSPGNVGAARRAGAREALRLLGADVLVEPRPERPKPAGPSRLDTAWLATTDGDSQVPPDWLTGMVALADLGADVVVGTVAVDDWDEHQPVVRERWRTAYGTGDPHPHVHGANLGLSAAAYERVGGFPSVAVGEDVALVEAGADLRVVRTRTLPVRTSGRASGRVVGGFADHLRGLAGESAGEAV